MAVCNAAIEGIFQGGLQGGLGDGQLNNYYSCSRERSAITSARGDGAGTIKYIFSHALRSTVVSLLISVGSFNWRITG
jgi:hypothetical protein